MYRGCGVAAPNPSFLAAPGSQPSVEALPALGDGLPRLVSGKRGTRGVEPRPGRNDYPLTIEAAASPGKDRVGRLAAHQHEPRRNRQSCILKKARR